MDGGEGRGEDEPTPIIPLCCPHRPSGWPSLGVHRPGVERLTLGAGPVILLPKHDQEPFKFMLISQMQRQVFEKTAVSTRAGAVVAQAGECKMLESSNFRKPPHRFIRIDLDILMHE